MVKIRLIWSVLFFLIVISSFISSKEYYPKENLTNFDSINLTGNGRLLQLWPDSNSSKPIIAWYDFDSKKQIAWIVAHNLQPPWEGNNTHRHLSIETSKANLGEVVTRMEFPYGKDIIDIRVVNSNLVMQTERLLYFASDQFSGVFYNSALKSLIFFANGAMRFKSSNGNFIFYSNEYPANRLNSSFMTIFGKGKGGEFLKIGHNGKDAIFEVGSGKIILNQSKYTPKNSNEICIANSIVFDDNHFYYCNSLGKWGRTNLDYNW